MFFVFRCYLLPFQVVTLYVLNVPEQHRKNTSFPWTRKRIDYFSFSGVLQQPCHRSESPANSHVMPTWVCAMAGIYGWGIQESAHLNMKTRNFVSGCGRGVPSGLGLAHCHRLRLADDTRDNCSDFYRLLSNLYTSFMVTKFSSTHCIRSSLSQHFMSMVLAKSIAEEE